MSKWKEEKNLITSLTPIAYIDYLNRIFAINLDPRYLAIDKLYYFKNNFDHIFPYSWNNKYLLVRLEKVFTSANSILTGDKWIPQSGGDVSEYTTIYYFNVMGVYDTEELCISESVLHGFRDVINDNNYYAKTPLINEIFHWDNGILSHSKVSVNFELNPDCNLWYKFNITHSTEFDKDFIVKKMLNNEHENPER